MDFYSASMYYSLGIPVDPFTPIFAVSRMPGWTAHVLEQYYDNRLIRPRADYTGDAVGQARVDLATLARRPEASVSRKRGRSASCKSGQEHGGRSRMNAA